MPDRQVDRQIDRHGYGYFDNSRTHFFATFHLTIAMITYPVAAFFSISSRDSLSLWVVPRLPLLYIYLCVYLSLHNFFSLLLRLCLFISLSLCLSIYHSIYLFIYLSVCVFYFALATGFDSPSVNKNESLDNGVDGKLSFSSCADFE